MKAVREEIFGPVVAAAPFSKDSDIVPTANNTDYGLGAGVFTCDISKPIRTAKRLRAGTVWINTWNVVDATLPCGGDKQTCLGGEMGHAGLNTHNVANTIMTRRRRFQ